jgi:hypothetical protein
MAGGRSLQNLNTFRAQEKMGPVRKAKKPAVKPKGKAKVSKVMDEWKAGTLHSGSKKGPTVTNQKQAIAIALSEARKAGQ